MPPRLTLHNENHPDPARLAAQHAAWIALWRLLLAPRPNEGATDTRRREAV